MDIRIIKKINDFEWEIPKQAFSGMNVPVRIFASGKLVEQSISDKSLEQAVNVAKLPGMQKYICVMPDVHQGYGFPIGGVAAADIATGVISPGGIGYDINCGVRFLSSTIPIEIAKKSMKELLFSLYSSLPSGIGKGKIVSISKENLRSICETGIHWAVKNGFGKSTDVELSEDNGCIEGADLDSVSDRAIERGLQQMGSLGSGNHFLEIDSVDEIYDEKAAKRMGLIKNCLVVQIHCGSRGFGHQVCSDYVREFQMVGKKYQIKIPERALVSAPIQSDEGQRYLSAMRCAANYAFCNRTVIAHNTRTVFNEMFEKKVKNNQLRLVYDLAHNIGKIEDHLINGEKRKVCVHRKGATRAFGPGMSEVSEIYRDIGQPVLIPGSMGTASWVMVGSKGSAEKTFGSCCHGAGRLLSRKQAKKKVWGEVLMEELKARGVRVIAGSMAGLAEEAPIAYKNVDEVVESVVQNEIARKVARLIPIGVIKG